MPHYADITVSMKMSPSQVNITGICLCCIFAPTVVPETQDVLCVCVCVCIFIKLHITAQSGPVICSFYATVCNPPGGYLS